MKKYILATAAAVFILAPCFSQDVITMKSGESIVVKILDIGTDTVTYKKYNNLEGPTYAILKSGLSLIRYANGTEVILNKPEKTTDFPFADSTTIVTSFTRGQLDAENHYKKYGGAVFTTVIPTVVIFPLGLVPAIVCSSTKPADKHLGYPDTDLMNDPEYKLGYSEKAKKIKRGKVWTYYIIGSLVNISIISAIHRANN